ncbi:MAG: class I SAM-dependent methyltransferase [Desulfobacterales bacterium]|nr:class I SAM-dependent methyltransferase [Desulfobacterales bacterium]
MLNTESVSKQMFDEFFSIQKDLEKQINSLPETEVLENPEYLGILKETAHGQALEIAGLANDTARKDRVKRVLRGHPFHQEILLGSQFIRAAYEKKYGYAGDKDLMLMICRNDWAGDSTYARLNNRVFLHWPAAEAVRQRAASFYESFKKLPQGSRVLSVGCGPAVEVFRFIRDFPERQVQFYLIDHDAHTIEYLNRADRGGQAVVKQGNLFKFTRESLDCLCNGDKVDLAYCSGVFDYIPDEFTASMAAVIFNQVKPGGRMMIGNYLSMSEENPHQPHMKLMMELYSEWNLIYRTPEQIAGFADGLDIPHTSFSVDNEYFGNRKVTGGAIGFLNACKA